MQNFLNWRPVKDVAKSVLMDFGIPFRLQYCSRNFIAVSPSMVLHRLAAGHLLYLSMESKIQNLRFWSVIGPMKSNWIFSFGAPNGGKLFCSVLGMLGLLFLPESVHSMQLSHFRCIAFVNLGHQKCFADRVILLMAGCPLWIGLWRLFAGWLVQKFCLQRTLVRNVLTVSSCIGCIRPECCRIDGAPGKRVFLIIWGRWLFPSSAVVTLWRIFLPFLGR